jgi:hypothetical protein
MSSVVQLATLAPTVVASLRRLYACFTPQSVIQVDTESCEIDWNPKAPFDPSMTLPLILLMAAIDEDAAQARWSDVSFVDALGTLGGWDADRKAIIWALAEHEQGSPFDEELLAWVARFNLGNKIVTVNRACVVTSHPNSHHCVRPIDHLAKLPAIIRKLPVPSQLAAVALLCFSYPEDADAVFNSKRFAVMNPPVLDAFATLRATAGAGPHLLRLIAAYQGW